MTDIEDLLSRGGASRAKAPQPRAKTREQGNVYAHKHPHDHDHDHDHEHEHERKNVMSPPAASPSPSSGPSTTLTEPLPLSPSKGTTSVSSLIDSTCPDDSSTIGSAPGCSGCPGQQYCQNVVAEGKSEGAALKLLLEEFTFI